MISLKKFKDALGDLKKELSEEEISKLLDNQDKMADILFNMWLEQKNNNKLS